jgi:anti-repressor protein
MNLPQIFNYEGNQVRTIIKDGEPLFVASDVCRILEIGNPSDVLKRLDDDERTLVSIEGASNGLPVNAVNEYGLYNLILGSRKPEAKEFKRWITHEVIPSIRKTGSYRIQHQLPQSMAEALRLAADLSEQNERIAAENERLATQSTEQQQKLKEQETPVAIYNLAIAAHNTQSMADVAKALGTGRTRLFNVLREERIIPEGRTVPYQRYIEAGYFVVRERPRASGDTVINDPVPRVTAKGLDYIARLLQKRQGA